MKKQVLFLQGGGGREDYEADAKLVASLQKELGEGYEVHYPVLPDEEAPDFGRISQIAKEITSIKGEVILVAHSLGASMLLKYLSESRVKSYRWYFPYRHTLLERGRRLEAATETGNGFS